MSPAPTSCGLSHSEKLNWLRPSSTSRWISHEKGAMFEYQRHLVRLLWQSKHARAASARVAGAFQFGSSVTGGFEWLRPYGTACASANSATAAIAVRTS